MKRLLSCYFAALLMISAFTGCGTAKGDEVTLKECGLSYTIPASWVDNEDANIFPISSVNTQGDIYAKVIYYYAPDENMDALNDLSSETPFEQLCAGLFELAVVREENDTDGVLDSELEQFSTIEELSSVDGFHFYFLQDWTYSMSVFTKEQQAVYHSLLEELPNILESIKTSKPDESLVQQESEENSEGSASAATENKLSFATTTLDEHYIDSTVFEDYDVTMVNFWASYCYPDINDLAELQACYEQLQKDYPNVNLIQVIIDTPSDENEATAKSALEEAGATFDSIIPNTSLANWVVSNLEGLPTTVFVDKDGVLLGDQIQGTQTKDGYMSAIEKVLDNLES